MASATAASLTLLKMMQDITYLSLYQRDWIQNCDDRTLTTACILKSASHFEIQSVQNNSKRKMLSSNLHNEIAKMAEDTIFKV